MSPTIRTADQGDADAIAHVAAVTFPLACPPGTKLDDIASHVTTHLSPEAFGRYLVDPDRTVLVVESESESESASESESESGDEGQGGLLGYAMLVRGEPADAEVAAVLPERPAVLLDKCYLLPAAQGTGAADLLVAAAVREAVATGASCLWLGVNRHNARAARFYERNGLRVVGRRSFRVGDVVHADDVRALVLAPR
ncbi:GNAT family N-acetyltransferase [Frigoribacterium salinisoli]